MACHSCGVNLKLENENLSEILKQLAHMTDSAQKGYLDKEFNFDLPKVVIENSSLDIIQSILSEINCLRNGFLLLTNCDKATAYKLDHYNKVIVGNFKETHKIPEEVGDDFTIDSVMKEFNIAQKNIEATLKEIKGPSNDFEVPESFENNSLKNEVKRLSKEIIVLKSEVKLLKQKLTTEGKALFVSKNSFDDLAKEEHDFMFEMKEGGLNYLEVSKLIRDMADREFT